MSELKDPKIKIFGKTIGLPEAFPEEKVGKSCDGAGEECSIVDPPASSDSDSMLEENNSDGDAEDQELNKNKSCLNQDKDEDRALPLASEKLEHSTTAPLSANSDAGPIQSSETEKDQPETSNSQEKTLKKPDKIIPCPRCNSMDTKFCYFNNYNVNQPRHFCRKCQRYWTAGGTMRNVPVGAGRRKNKNAASQFRHLSILEGLQNARADLPNGTHHPVVSPNGTVIAFSSDAPLCESMVSVLNIADKTVGTSVSNGLKENGDDHSSGSSCTAVSCSKDELGKTGLPEQIPNCHPFPPQVPCFPGAPWLYPWHSVQWTALVSHPPASFAMPFYSSAPPYWGCAVPGPWNVPWLIPPTPSQSQTPPNSCLNSPTLGKHSRDEKTLKPIDPEEVSENERRDPGKCLWVPKTLRIADPGEAAKSSIWATLGIKNERAGSVGSGGLLKVFEGQSKGGEKTQAPEANTVLQANPAALSRSLSFHESSQA